MRSGKSAAIRTPIEKCICVCVAEEWRGPSGDLQLAVRPFVSPIGSVRQTERGCEVTSQQDMC